MDAWRLKRRSMAIRPVHAFPPPPCQHVFEGIFQLGKRTRLVQELAGLKTGKPRLKLPFGDVSDAPEESGVDVLANNRGRLKELLIFGC